MASVEEEEMTLFTGQSDTKLLAVGGILAAVYGLGSLLPVSGFIAAPGVVATISVTILVAPLFGILLGPSRGFVFGLIGGVVAYLVGGSGGLYILVPPIILGPALSGLFTGLSRIPLTEVRGIKVPGPSLTSLYIVGIIILYLMVNMEAWWFMILYILAAGAAIGLQITGNRLDLKGIGSGSYLSILPFALIGTITDFSMMTMGAVYILSIPAAVFGTVIFPAMLIERSAAIAVSMILVVVLAKAFPDLWPEP
ncbi:MAG: hypothetical protein ACW99U_01920 [Candidatus Thorarchaeota archaeon]|jgi:hypothetical protein